MLSYYLVNYNIFILYMKNNKKTLKRKSLLKKRKGGKTARRRIKKGGDLFKPSTWKSPFSSTATPVVSVGMCDKYGCCSTNSLCDGPRNFGKKHFISTINQTSENLNEKIFIYGDRKNNNTDNIMQTPAYYMKLLGLTELSYCSECMRVFCDPKKIPASVIHSDDVNGSNFI